MKDYIGELVKIAEDKIGAMMPLVEAALSKLQIAMREGDAEKCAFYGKQVAELGAALSRLGTVVQKAGVSGDVTFPAVSDGAIALQACIDEAEDILQGYDEDTGTPSTKWKVGDIKGWLDKNEIEYDEKAKKDELLVLVEGVLGES